MPSLAIRRSLSRAVGAALIVALAACGGGRCQCASCACDQHRGQTVRQSRQRPAGRQCASCASDQPGQTCVSCATTTPAGNSAPTAPATYTIGGTVRGLTGSGLVLQNNVGDDLPIAADGRFIFATPIASGASYAVTVRTQPGSPTQTCTVNNGNNDVTDANVETVDVICATNTYTTGGTVSGLTGSGLVLLNNGGDELTISANGRYVFAAPIASGAQYDVTVKTQPGSPTQTCTVVDKRQWQWQRDRCQHRKRSTSSAQSAPTPSAAPSVA